MIDANSGAVAARMAGQVWDEQAEVVSAMVKKRGNTLITITEDEKERWRKATQPVIDTWVKTSKDRGLDGEKLLESARAALAKHEKTA